jgi:hypothetical protein
MTLEALGDLKGAIAQFHNCEAVPVNNFTWTPRTIWPENVNEYCRGELLRLSGNSSP